MEIVRAENFNVDQASVDAAFEASRGDLRQTIGMLQMLSLSYRNKALTFNTGLRGKYVWLFLSILMEKI
jgi:hypothetical protein